MFLGIERVYGGHKRGEIIVFDDLRVYLDQKARYSYRLDERGEVREPKEIEDKATFHLLDAERYIIGWRYRTVSNPWAQMAREALEKKRAEVEALRAPAQ